MDLHSRSSTLENKEKTLPKLNIAKGVQEANSCMGFEPGGTLHTQVERLMAELGINDK